MIFEKDEDDNLLVYINMLAAAKVVESEVEEDDDNIQSYQLKLWLMIHLMPPSNIEVLTTEEGQVYQEYQCKNQLKEDDQQLLKIAHYSNTTKPYSYGYIMRRVKAMAVSSKLYQTLNGKHFVGEKIALLISHPRFGMKKMRKINNTGKMWDSISSKVKKRRKI